MLFRSEEVPIEDDDEEKSDEEKDEEDDDEDVALRNAEGSQDENYSLLEKLGEGSCYAAMEEFDDAQVNFALLRVTGTRDQESKTVKFVFLTFVGPSVGDGEDEGAGVTSIAKLQAGLLSRHGSANKLCDELGEEGEDDE